MSITVEFWYDFSSPFAYLGATQVERVVAGAGGRVEWKPMLLGALFKEVGTPNVPMFAASPAKQRYFALDMGYWASHWGVPFKFPSRFPMKTVTALRLALLAGDRIAPLSLSLFRAYWVDDGDLNDEATLSKALSDNGLDARELLERTRDPEIKQRLVENTSEAARKGVFGAPTFIVKQPAGDLLFWGQDRLVLV